MSPDRTRLGEQTRPAAQWYVNSQGQTMVVIPGPVEFLMGSPPTEADRDRTTRRSTRGGSVERLRSPPRPVTMEQFQRFDQGYDRLV